MQFWETNSLAFSCLHPSLPWRKYHSNFIITSFMCHRPLPFFLLEHLFCLSHCEPVVSCQLVMWALKYCLLGTSNSTDHCRIVFPWCKLKWSWDEFNKQSNILQGLGKTSWSMVETTPKVHNTQNQQSYNALIYLGLFICVGLPWKSKSAVLWCGKKVHRYPKPTPCNTSHSGVFETRDCDNKVLVLSKVKVPSTSPNQLEHFFIWNSNYIMRTTILKSHEL